MRTHKRLLYDQQEIKVQLGSHTINVFYISYLPPDPAWTYDSHSHSTYELHYIPGGYGTLSLFHQEYRIEPGTFYLTGPGVFHRQSADEADPMSEFCINFEIKMSKQKRKKSDVYITSEISRLFTNLMETNFWFGKDEYQTDNCFLRIFDELEKKLLGYHSLVQSLLAQVIIHAIRSIASDKSSDYSIPGKHLDDSRRNAVDIYLMGYDKKLSKQELAKSLRISVRQLERIVRRYYGASFHERLTEIRLEHAKEMLSGAALSIGDVAQASGFDSAAYFSRVFRTKTGMAPTRYAALMRGNGQDPVSCYGI